jgi:diguanylate cyclase (GGDEF)-like protein/PAS domain S-box-containing protein
MELDKIKSIMSTDVITLGPEESLISAVRIMSNYNLSCIVVVEQNKPAGIVTERDIIHLTNTNLDFNSISLQLVMQNPVIAVSEEAEIPEAANLMVINELRRLVVVNEAHHVIGIITQTDIIKNLSIDSFISFKKIEQIMNRRIISVTQEDSLSKIISLMSEKRISCVPVLDRKKPVGIVTERDITRAIANNSISKHAKEIMRHPVPLAGKEMNLYDATRLMDEHKMSSLIVVNDAGDATGIVTKSDIIKNLRADYIEILKNMLKEKSRALVESELKYRTLVEQSLEGILILQDGLIRFVNPTLLKILNYDEQEIVGKDIMRFLCPDERGLFSENLTILETGQKVDCPLEIRMLHKNEECLFMEVLLTQIQYEGKPAVLTTLRNITERKKTEAELKRLVITDDLTGIYNQRYFYTHLNKEVERAKRHQRPLSLLLIDIDKFKDFNDKYGHWEGDYVLKRIGDILLKNVRDIDMPFRYGGEEFTVILPETSLEDALIVAERIRKAVAQNIFYPFTLDGQPEVVSKTVSIGVTEFLSDDTMKSFLKRADNAMYQAKKRGRNMVLHLLQ